MLSKYGVRSIATGSVRVRINCVQQCKAFKDEVSTTVSRKKWQTALQLARGRATQHAIHGVIGELIACAQKTSFTVVLLCLEAYQRARKRMHLARESVPNQIRLSAAKAAQIKLRTTTDEEKIRSVLAKLKTE